jgi:hypothetical protein
MFLGVFNAFNIISAGRKFPLAVKLSNGELFEFAIVCLQDDQSTIIKARQLCVNAVE